MHQNIADDDSPADIPAATGRLYRYTPDGRLSQVTDDTFGITNTLVWPEPDVLIVADTLENTIYRYQIGADGTLGPRKVLGAPLDRGLPDGSCTDASGDIWNARVVGGYAVAHLGKDGGLKAFVDVPCSWPTSCAFGGSGLETLFVTSARFTMTEAHLSEAPFAGGLFAVQPGSQERPPNRFGAA